MPSQKTARRKRHANSVVVPSCTSSDIETTLNNLKRFCSRAASEQVKNASKMRIEKLNTQLIDAERTMQATKKRHLTEVQTQLTKKKQKCVDDMQRKLAELDAAANRS